MMGVGIRDGMGGGEEVMRKVSVGEGGGREEGKMFEERGGE